MKRRTGVTWDCHDDSRGVTWDFTNRTLARVAAAVACALGTAGAFGAPAALAGGPATPAAGPLAPATSPPPPPPSTSPASAAGPQTATPVTPLPDLASVEQLIGAPQAWQAGANGQGVDVALLDTGVTPVPGLAGASQLVYGADLSFDSQNPQTAYLDNYGHGTAMAGIIAGNDGTPGGFQGVAPDAQLVSVKVGSSNGAADVSQIIAGIDWVVAHAHDNGMDIRVLNLSLGTDSTQSYLLDPLAHAAEVAWRHGIVVVVAAGNNGNGTALTDPADDPYLIAVGADDPQGSTNPRAGAVAGFSSGAPGPRQLDLVAPGANIVSLRDPGSYLDQQYPNAVVNGRFFRGSGTSEAAAVTSGAAADLLSAYPNLTPDQVKHLLTNTAVKLPGQPPFLQGAGVLQVGAAVAAAGRGPGPSGPANSQHFQISVGLGSLEAARGNSHVSLGGVELTGEQDIFGDPWVPTTMVPAEETVTAWNGGTYNGATWTGGNWSNATWSGATWSGATWSGATWSGATWSGVTWSSATWSGATWS